MMMNTRYNQGFTLIELILVIVILGVLTVYAASTFVGASSFSPYAAQSQAISVIRQIQLARLEQTSKDSIDSYKLVVINNCLGSQVGSETDSCHSNDAYSTLKVQVDGDDMNFAISPSESVIAFDLFGNPCDGENCDSHPDYKIIISSSANPDESTAVCINSQGFVSRGIANEC